MPGKKAKSTGKKFCISIFQSLMKSVTLHLSPLEDKSSRKFQGEFERLYIKVREKEQRLYSDESLKKLPYVDRHHPHFEEWRSRNNSCKSFIRYLQKYRTPVSILEVGCGNGWLCNQISTMLGTDVTGIDVNRTEIEQAKRVFENDSNLRFYMADLQSECLMAKKFDIILFAASIQYFPSLSKVIDQSQSMLVPGGEIHIIDSFFYEGEGANLAKERTAHYYKSMGVPEMTHHYFHHKYEELSPYSYVILKKPSRPWEKIWGANQVFPWIRIKSEVNA
ncbi:MAG: hypothetical protein C5B52_11315 [Bacteroidetes bacterium]|nr:MAG: hypothetical protein C5B52_11315 [Bacteroidota bacterium]